MAEAWACPSALQGHVFVIAALLACVSAGCSPIPAFRQPQPVRPEDGIEYLFMVAVGGVARAVVAVGDRVVKVVEDQP